jgi:hypothetical protein
MEATPSANYPPTIIHQGDKADILEKIRPDEIVEIIRNRLMGKEFVEGKWEKVASLKERSLTEVGAWDLSNLMLCVSSRNVSLSKLKDDEIKKRTLNICKQAQVMALKNWKEYGIKGTDQLGFIHEIIMSNTLITLKQPEGEGIRKMLMGTVSEQRTYLGTDQEQTKKGLRGLFKK